MEVIMKIAYKRQVIERKNSELCVVTEYPELDGQLDFAIVKLSGRYPDTKRAVNLTCKEIVYIHEGHGQVEVNGECYSLDAGDLVLIESGEKFIWEGQMTLYISCHPAFNVEQHQIVD